MRNSQSFKRYVIFVRFSEGKFDEKFSFRPKVKFIIQVSANMATAPFRRVVLFGNTFQTKKSMCAPTVLKKLEEKGAQIIMEPHFSCFLERELHIGTACYPTISKNDFQADLAISFGGDGTFLAAAAAVGAKGIPILGINAGSLGFLADVSPDEVGNALDALYEGNYAIEQRTVIKVQKDGSPLAGYPYALNDVAILKHDNSSLIRIHAYVDGERLADYAADGLIVCTPTGSTGYSLSAGGPVLVPGSETFCLSAVAPHTLSTRPVVVRDSVVIKLTVESRSHRFLLSIDGRSESFDNHTTITLSKASYQIRVVKIWHKHFFDTLREKMMWGADGRI